MIFRSLGIYGRKRAGLGGFFPTDIAGLQLWGKWNDSTTLNSKICADFVSANTEYLSSASTDFDKGDEDFSFGCWVNFDNIGDDYTHLMGKYDDSTNNRSFTMYGRVNQIHISFSSNGQAGTVSSITDATTFSNGTWYLVVCVYDATANLIKRSINGGAFVTAAHSGGAYSGSTADFTIGNSIIAGANQPFDGLIDQAFFYNKALTEAQCNTLYNSGNGTQYENADTTSLVSWWKLDEKSGTRFDAHSTNDLTDNNTVGYGFGKLSKEIGNNDYVWRFVDQSANGVNYDQNTASDQPQWTNSKEFTFDGASDNFPIDDLLTYCSTDTKGTFCLWVKPTTALANNRFVIFGDTDANFCSFLLYGDTNGKLQSSWLNNTPAYDYTLVTDNVVFSDNTWCHIAIVQDGVSPVIYINGQLADITFTVSSDTTVWFNDYLSLDNGRIGCRNYNSSGNGQFFNGSIGEPLYYNTNLTSSQIQQIYNNSLSIYS